MTAYQGWTPAAKRGFIPLRPLTFGEIFGKSFASLRQNPRVMLGFALGFQLIATLIGIAVIGLVTYDGAMRLATVTPYSQDWQEIEAGNTLMTVIISVVIGVVTGSLSAVIQGIVAAQIAASVVGEHASLRRLWQRVRPVAGRLVLYTFAVAFGAMLIAAPGFGLVIAGAATDSPGLALIGIPLLLAVIPLYVWLAIRLLFVPSVYVIEHASFADGIRRGWRLTHRRFWRTFGAWVLINIIIQFAANVISTPIMLIVMAVSGVLAPTGRLDESMLVTFIIGMFASAAIAAIVGAIGFIVLASASTLMYVDARMRDEGLDLRLMAYTDRIAAGDTPTEDPWAYDPTRPVPQRPQYPQPGYPQPGYAQPGYAQPGYGVPAYPQPGPAYPGAAYPGQQIPAAPAPYPGQQTPAAYPAPPSPYAPSPNASSPYAPSPYAPSPYPPSPYPGAAAPQTPDGLPQSTPPQSTPPQSTQWQAPGGGQQ